MKGRKEPFQVDYDNLAIPEIHTKRPEAKKKETKEESVTYDGVAVPEIHIRKKKSSQGGSENE